jgi:hypothetical protein
MSWRITGAVATGDDRLYSIAGAPALDLRFASTKTLRDYVSGRDLVTFSRASAGGTYVDSDGLIKTAATNLLLRSEEFDNASTIKINATVTANAIASPAGTLTADKIVENTAASASHIVANELATVVSGTVYTLSVFCKAAERSWVFMLGSGPAFGTNGIYVNLSTGATGSSLGSPGSAVVTPFGNGWYRISFSLTAGSSGTSGLQVRTATGDNGGVYTGDGTSGIYAWGAQLEVGSTATEYLPTSASINSAPRFQHDPLTGQCLGLLVEESRANSIRNNTMVGAVAGTPGTLPTNWSQVGGTGLTREIVGTGTENGISYIDIKFSGTTGTTFTGVYFDAGMSGFLTGTAYTASVYVKRVAGSTSNLSNLGQYIRYNLSPNGQTDITTALATLNGPTDALINSRFTTTGTTTGTLSGVAGVFVLFSHSSGVAVDITLRLGLPQVEAGAFVTSPILTTGTSATRSADIATITTLGSSIRSLFAQVRGPASGTRGIIGLDDNSVSNRIELLTSGTDPKLLVTTGGSAVADLDGGTVAANAETRLAARFAADNYAISVGGGAEVVDTAGALPAVDRIRIGALQAGSTFTGTIARLTAWDQVLPNLRNVSS